MSIKTFVVLFLGFEVLLNLVPTVLVFTDPALLLEPYVATGDTKSLAKFLAQPAAVFFLQSYGVFTLGFAVFFTALLMHGDAGVLTTVLRGLLLVDVAYSYVSAKYFLDHIPQPWSPHQYFVVGINVAFFVGRLLCLLLGVEAKKTQQAHKKTQ